MKRLEIFDVVFAVVSKLCANKLVDSQLINVENELGDDLIGAGEDLLDDGVMLTAKWNDSFEDVFTTDVAGLLSANNH